jgi:hypothetical protein
MTEAESVALLSSRGHTDLYGTTRAMSFMTGFGLASLIFRRNGAYSAIIYNLRGEQLRPCFPTMDGCR